MLGAAGGLDGAGVAAAGALAGSGGGGEEDEPVSEPNQRLTRLPLLTLAPPVSALAVVVHCPEAPAVRVGFSVEVAEEPCAPGETEVEKAAIAAAPDGVPPPSAMS